MDNTQENTPENSRHPLQTIDLTGIIRTRVGGWKGKMIPGFMLRGLERLVRQDELNAMLRYAYPAEGSEFSEKILEHLNIRLDVRGLEDLPCDEPLVFASNHPLGGLDGIAMVAVLGRHYGDGEIAVLVNDMLMNVTPLRDVFLPINKYGRQGRKSAEAINRAYEEGKQLLVFPAGLVSRLGDDGVIRDLKWQKAFVSKSLEHGRRVVPVHFEALNSKRFYKAARLRKKLGIKVNLEQALLPGELVKAGGTTFRITFGKPIDVKEMASRELSPEGIAAHIRNHIYENL